MKNKLIYVLKLLVPCLLVLLLLCACRGEEGEKRAVSMALEAAGSYETLLCGDEARLVEEILLCLEKAGYAATDVLSERGFVNPEIIEAAFDERGEKTLEFIRVYHDGSMMFTRLHMGQERSCENVRLKREENKLVFSYYEAFPISYITLSDMGRLIYTCDIPDNTAASDHDGYIEPTTMLRLYPQKPVCKEFQEKYISPIGYNYNGLFTADWDTDSMDSLCLNDLFLSFYRLSNGIYISHFNSPYPLLQTGPVSIVPKEEFEALICEYINIDPQYIETAAHYDAKAGGYPVFIDGPHDGLARIPVPEVSDVVENPDGSYTLNVDALFVEYATDCAFSHKITLELYNDGSFRYLSNEVLINGDNIFPQYESYFKNW